MPAQYVRFSARSPWKCLPCVPRARCSCGASTPSKHASTAASRLFSRSGTVGPPLLPWRPGVESGERLEEAGRVSSRRRGFPPPPDEPASLSGRNVSAFKIHIARVPG